MKYVISILFIFSLSACTDGGGKDKSQAEDPIYGDWYYDAPGQNDSAYPKGWNGNDSLSLHICKRITATSYVRKLEGTFTRSVSVFYRR